MKREKTSPSSRGSKPSWHFPPTGGGVEVIQESATTNFRESPLDKFVREILQNSTDAHDHNFGSVEVAFQEALYQAELFGADTLLEHTQAALLAANEENRPKLAEQYQKASETLSNSTIRCLNIADRNTTGLVGENWAALLTKSGAVRKKQTTAGGDRGMGKNAVFNVSAAKTAFYYTCFQEGRGRRRHRVEKWMGKSVLTAHEIDGETRQHIGFFRHGDGRAIEGSAIPEPFRMKAELSQPNIPPTGTTITVVGFEPQSGDWPEEIAKSTAANFFFAIHRGQLVVSVVDINGSETWIDRNTIRNIFASHDQDPRPGDPFSRSHSYYRAICGDAVIEDIALPAPIDGTVEARLVLGDDPSRSAYVNWNGMFVTDSREVTKNPFHIRTPLYCPDYAIIVTPKDDQTNEFIRDLENVAHDEIQPNSIEDARQQRQVKLGFQEGRRQLRELVNARIDRSVAEGNRNLHHLAGIVGDEQEIGTGEPSEPLRLSSRTRKQNFQTAAAMTIAETPNPGGPPATPSGGVRSDDSQPPRKPMETSGAPNPPRPKASTIGRVRLVAGGAYEVAVMFTTFKPGQTVKLRLSPSGEMVSNEAALKVSGATEQQSAKVVLDDDTITIEARHARRYRVYVSLAEDISKTALSVRNIA